MKNTKNHLKSKIFLASSLLQLVFSGPAMALLAPRLQPQEDIKTNTGTQIESITLHANSDQKPLLLVHQKRSIDLIVPKAGNKSDLNLLQSRGITLDLLNQVFSKHSQSLEDYYFIDYFSHGYKDFKPEDVFKRSIVLKDETRYWTAIVPRDFIVNDIIVQRQWFDNEVGTHGQIRFKLNTPLLLFPQTEVHQAWNFSDIRDFTTDTDYTKPNSQWKNRVSDFYDRPQLLPGDLIYALMAIRYEGGPQNWDTASGLTGVFGIAYTLTSTDHMAVYQAGSDYVEQIRIKSPKDNGKAVLTAALRDANSRREKDIYHLIFNSCITTVLRVLSFGYDLDQAKISDKYSFNPYRFIENLKPITDTTVNLPSLNQEYASSVQKATLTPQVQSHLAQIQTDEFDLAARSFAKEILDLNYAELNYTIQVAGLAAPEIKKGTDPKMAIAQAQQTLGQNRILPPEGLQAKLQSKVMGISAVLKSNPQFLSLISKMTPKETPSAEIKP